MDIAFLAGVVYGITAAIKEQFGTNGNVTRAIALAFGLLFTLGTEVRVLAEYGAAEWLDIVITTLVLGLGLTTIFHKTVQAVGLRSMMTVSPSTGKVNIHV
jgi:hypothetical protein